MAGVGHARHPLSLLALAATVLAAGCGSSDSDSQGTGSEGPARTSTAPAGAATETCTAGEVAGIGEVRVSGVECTPAHEVVVAWDAKEACGAAAGVSRVACSVGGYRCLGTATERGLAVSCAAPSRTISFLAKRH